MQNLDMSSANPIQPKPTGKPKPTVSVKQGDYLDAEKVISIFNAFMQKDDELENYVNEFLQAASKLKDWNILRSTAYSSTREETFLFFLEFYANCEEQEEMKKTLEIALNFMKKRQRPWSVLIFHPLEKTKKQKDVDSLFGSDAKIKHLYVGKKQEPTLLDYMQERK